MNTTDEKNTQQGDDKPRIYVACLASYNAGVLYGEWISADQEPESIQEDVNQMLQRSPVPDAEESAIHDYENFCGISIDEHEGFERVSFLACCIAEHGESFALYASSVGLKYATEENFLEAYIGEYESEEDYAEELYNDCYKIPDYLQNFIDWARVARDLFCGDHFSMQSQGRTFIYRLL